MMVFIKWYIFCLLVIIYSFCHTFFSSCDFVLAVCIERVVHDKLMPQNLVIIFKTYMEETLCDSFESGRFGLSIQIFTDVRTMHDL